MHPDHQAIWRFTTRQRIETSINTLLGIIEGVSIDEQVNAVELAYLRQWLAEHESVRQCHPYSELIPVIDAALADGRIAADEHANIVWVCDKLKATDFYDSITADMQRLQAILVGIAADQVIGMNELAGLSAWLSDHSHLETLWPYQEVCALLTAVLADRRIDQQEHAALLTYFKQFGGQASATTSGEPPSPTPLTGICAVCPEITFEGQTFCFTGASTRYTRAQFASIIEGLGGFVSSKVTPRLNYLVIGADGNPCWTYACYGRKVEEAMRLRQDGTPIVIIHENDLHDAIADAEG